MSEEIRAARQWMTKALNDLLCADNNLNAARIPCDTVCFHCQQAAEKMLKACLVAHDQPYPISHDLFLLMEKLKPLRPDIKILRDPLAILNPYGVAVRYPDDFFTPTLPEAKEARTAAQQVMEWLGKTVPELTAGI